MDRAQPTCTFCLVMTYTKILLRTGPTMKEENIKAAAFLEHHPCNETTPRVRSRDVTPSTWPRSTWR